MIRKTFKVLIPGERVYVGVDRLGVPQYRYEPDIELPFAASIQPTSNKIAMDRYGLDVDVSDMLYVRKPPAELDKGANIVGNGKKYKVVECLPYQRHAEVLAKVDVTAG